MLRVAYNTVARWSTRLPLNTRTTNLITLVYLPPMEAYLDYLSLRYAIRLHFLPTHMPWDLHATCRIHVPTSQGYTIFTI